jgi:DNA-binding CsgD family transcriptional regulator
LRAVGTVVEYLTMGGAGKAPETDRLCDTLEALADDVGLPPDRALARVYRASLLGGRGEFDAAAGQIERARGVLTRQPAPDVIAAVVALVEGVIFQHVAADWPRLASEMWELARNPERSGWLSLTFAAFAGQAFARAGEADQARKLLGHILAALEPVELLDARTSSPVGLAGAAVWELRAADLAARLLPRAAALGDADRRAGYLTSQDLTAARLNSLLGRFDPALEYFARARLKLEHREQPVLRAIVDYDEAVARLANKRPGAATLLSAASARFEQLGMREWSGRAALVKVRGDGFPDGLTAREAEILRFLALGKTNREIAGELVISVHTVERHVQNAYRKIEVRNRAEASSYVARVGLWHASDRPT